MNRNKKTEAIRVPIIIVDLVNEISEATGRSKQDTLMQIFKDYFRLSGFT